MSPATKLKTLPRKPGVYKFFSDAGKLIYVGKAVDLKARVSSYFSGRHDGRVQFSALVKKIVDLEVVITQTEREALILERQLIAKHQPRYNIRLKDDKEYYSVKIDESKPWPRLELVRRVDDDRAVYFGPFTSGYKVRELLTLINKLLPLRTCADTVLNNRQRPCLEHQMKRCAAPCCLEVNRLQYKEWLTQAKQILKGRSKELQAEIVAEMESAASGLNFERAALLRDRAELLAIFNGTDKVQAYYSENRDAWGVYREGELVAVTVMHVRSGRIVDSKPFTFSEVLISSDELLSQLITSYYEKEQQPVSEILVPPLLNDSDLLIGYLEEKLAFKPNLVTPLIGSKRALLDMAEANAAQLFRTEFLRQDMQADLAKEMAKQFSLSQLPRHIECVDISNLGATAIVAGLTCFKDGMPDKSGYRHYNIKTVSGAPDDFKSIGEVVGRRLRAGLRNGDLPDLIIIDGGRSQLREALAARNSCGADVDIISLAKARTANKYMQAKEERVFLPGAPLPIVLPDGAALTLFMARIRDETHRFAITFHRKKRERIKVTTLRLK